MSLRAYSESVGRCFGVDEQTSVKRGPKGAFGAFRISQQKRVRATLTTISDNGTLALVAFIHMHLNILLFNIFLIN